MDEWKKYEKHGFLNTVWWPENKKLHGKPFTVKRRAICVAGIPSWRVVVETEDGKEEHLLTPLSIIGMNIGMYADQTGLFTEEDLDNDNTYNVDVPFDLWREWCKLLSKEQGRVIDPIAFEDEYTYDSTVGFYDFCMERGYEPLCGWDLRHITFNFEGGVA